MPASATITAYYTFAPLTSIRSAYVNANFALWRGHVIPIDPTLTAAAHHAYDLGSDEHAWRGVYGQYLNLYQNTAGSVPAAPTAGTYRLYFKDDGILYKKSPAGAEAAVGSGTGGGGGSALNWVEDIDSPTSVFEYSGQAYVFEDAVTQYIYAQIRVPNSYVTGSQINLRGIFYASGTSSTVFLKTQATLVRTGSDAMSSTTNQRTSTNSAVTLATTANRPNSIVCDLSDASGLINSVTITAGDVILVKLYRDFANDTFAGDAMFPAYASEVTFA